MRKVLIFLLFLLLCIPCQAEEAASLDEKDFVLFLQAGVEIHLGQDAEAAASLLAAQSGLAFDCLEADSCMFSGKDKEYSNEALVLGSYPIGPQGGDALESMLIFSPDYQTARGAKVGFSKAEIETLYGLNYVLDYDQMLYQYGEDGPMLIFTLNVETDAVTNWMLLRNTVA